MKATPPLPDWLLTRMIASYVRPTSCGSIGRDGTSQASVVDAASASIPFLIASWCEPEKAVYTRSPAYGCRGWTGSWLHASTVRRRSSDLRRPYTRGLPRTDVADGPAAGCTLRPCGEGR